MVNNNTSLKNTVKDYYLRNPSGTLKNFDFTEELEDIKEPCLIISGLLDLCSPLIAKTIYDKIPNSQWELFEFSHH